MPNELPPHGVIDFEIKVKPDQTPLVRPVIRLNPIKLSELKWQLHVLLSKVLLSPSSPPYDGPVFFVKKKDGDLRMICDYRGLNGITKSDANPLPLIDVPLHQASNATIFSKVYLIGAYHQIRIAEDDCHKTTIRTKFGSFE